LPHRLADTFTSLLGLRQHRSDAQQIAPTNTIVVGLVVVQPVVAVVMVQ
jgi:hypothetical protein